MVLFSLVATCVMHGVNPRTHVADVPLRVRGSSGTVIAMLAAPPLALAHEKRWTSTRVGADSKAIEGPKEGESALEGSSLPLFCRSLG